MARIRTIKPDFFTSEDIVELEPIARLLYIALWCEADREGRMSWKPRTFKMRYLPGDDCDIDALCDALVTRGLVCLYGDGLAYIPAFSTHQHVNPREAVSALPDPDAENSRVSDASARVRQPSVTCREEGKGKEGKGRIDRRVEDASATKPEKQSRAKPKVQIPEGYAFPMSVREYGARRGFSQSELDHEQQKFIRYAKQNDKRWADWDMAAENWLDKAAEFSGKPPPVSPKEQAAAKEALSSMYYARADSDQLQAWDSHSMATRGKLMPRDKNFGWFVPEEWPPGYVPPEKPHAAPIIPRPNSMQGNA